MNRPEGGAKVLVFIALLGFVIALVFSAILSFLAFDYIINARAVDVIGNSPPDMWSGASDILQAVIGIPVAFAGAIVAIVLAVLGVKIASNQVEMAKRQLEIELHADFDEKTDRLRAEFEEQLRHAVDVVNRVDRIYGYVTVALNELMNNMNKEFYLSENYFIDADEVTDKNLNVKPEFKEYVSDTTARLEKEISETRDKRQRIETTLVAPILRQVRELISIIAARTPDERLEELITYHISPALQRIDGLIPEIIRYEMTNLGPYDNHCKMDAIINISERPERPDRTLQLIAKLKSPEIMGLEKRIIDSSWDDLPVENLSGRLGEDIFCGEWKDLDDALGRILRVVPSINLPLDQTGDFVAIHLYGVILKLALNAANPLDYIRRYEEELQQYSHVNGLPQRTNKILREMRYNIKSEIPFFNSIFADSTCRSTNCGSYVLKSVFRGFGDPQDSQDFVHDAEGEPYREPVYDDEYLWGENWEGQ